MLSNKELTFLNYSSNLNNSYQQLSHLPGFVLLESTDRLRGRFDIISAYPYDTLVIREILPKSTLLQILKEKLPQDRSEFDLPFQGGAIGYVSYDLGAQLFGIHAETQSSLGEMPLLDLGLYDWAIIVDHHLKKVTLFAANNHPDTAKIKQEILKLWSQNTAKIPHFIAQSDFSPLLSQDAYHRAFDSIQKALKAGRSYQVNFTQPFHASYEGDVWMLYQHIKFDNPVPFSAFLRTSEADILSFSPERFIKYQQGHMITSPIKGTIARSDCPLEDESLKNQLVTSIKNRAENVMIVDLLRNDLGKIARPGSVKVSALCEIQSYKALHHLVSTVEAQCVDTLHPVEAFLSCFPGGSITGAPKLEAMKIINEQEAYARGVYCGSIGYFSHHGCFDTNIAIRTITAKNNRLHLAAGGGIVVDSVCEEEYEECYTKIAAISAGL